MQRTDLRLPAPRPSATAADGRHEDGGPDEDHEFGGAVGADADAPTGAGPVHDDRDHDDQLHDGCEHDAANSCAQCTAGAEAEAEPDAEADAEVATTGHRPRPVGRGRHTARRQSRGAKPARGRALLRRARQIVAWALCAVLAAIVGTAAWVWWVARQDARPTVDAILVLGASQYDGRPSPVLLARLEHALALYREGVAPRIVTVGGNMPGDRFTEAGTGRRWLIAHEVAETSVFAVPEGRDTLQSVQAVAELMRAYRWRSVVIVTDPWHALRSRSMARAEGLDASTSPARQGPAVRSRSTQAKYVGRETAAYLHWWLLRRSSGFGHGVV